MSKSDELKHILVTLREHCGFDVSLKNNNGKTAAELVRQRINAKNPYDTNLSEIIKIEILFRDDNLARSCDPKIRGGAKHRKQRSQANDYQQLFAL